MKAGIIRLLWFALIGGAFLTISDFQFILETDLARTLPKAMGQLIIIVASVFLIFQNVSNLRVRSCDYVAVAAFSATFMALFVSQFINNPSESAVPLLRFVASLLLLLSIFSAPYDQIRYGLRIVLVMTLLVTIIGIAFFALQIDPRERFPLIGLGSTKSIIFEQNVFGILCFFGGFSVLYIQKNLRPTTKYLLLTIFFAGCLLSYYKTVIILFSFMFLLRPYRSNSIADIALIFCLTFFSWKYFEAITLLSQIGDNGLLSGRTGLWGAGWEIYKTAPVFGIGEFDVARETSRYIHRANAPPFTTFHNFIIDITVSAGLLGAISIFYQFLYAFLRLRWKAIPFVILTAPSLFNTYYLGAPNALGMFLALAFAFLVYIAACASDRYPTTG